MCITPIRIKNPNKGRDPTKGLNKFKDCTAEYIEVPCGNCPDCIALEQMYMVQRVQMEATKNWLFMGTVTYNNEHLPRLTTSQGYEYRYTDVHHIQNTIKRLREHNTFEIPFRHITVTERGGKGGRPHAHTLLLFDKETIGKHYEDAQDFAIRHQWDLFNEWKINKGTDKFPKYEQLSDYHESYRGGIKHKTYDFHFVDPRLTDSGITDAAFYVLKYMLKGSSWENKIKSALKLNYDAEEYSSTWNTIKSRQIHSLGFGLNAEVIGKGHERKLIFDENIINYLRENIERSKKGSYKYANYFCPESLLSFPLAPYYKSIGNENKNEKPIYTVDDAETFYLKQDNTEATLDNFIIHNREVTQSIKKFNDYERKLKLAENDIFSEFLQDLYND